MPKEMVYCHTHLTHSPPHNLMPTHNPSPTVSHTHTQSQPLSKYTLANTHIFSHTSLHTHKVTHPLSYSLAHVFLCTSHSLLHRLTSSLTRDYNMCTPHAARAWKSPNNGHGGSLRFCMSSGSLMGHKPHTTPCPPPACRLHPAVSSSMGTPPAVGEKTVPTQGTPGDGKRQVPEELGTRPCLISSAPLTLLPQSHLTNRYNAVPLIMKLKIFAPLLLLSAPQKNVVGWFCILFSKVDSTAS